MINKQIGNKTIPITYPSHALQLRADDARPMRHSSTCYRNQCFPSSLILSLINFLSLSFSFLAKYCGGISWSEFRPTGSFNVRSQRRKWEEKGGAWKGCLRKRCVPAKNQCCVGLLTGSELPAGSVGYWHSRLSRGAN